MYHAAYLRFLERGRTEFLRRLGIEQSQLFAQGHAFAVRSMTLDFLRPARMDDCIEVVTALHALGGASLEVHQRIVHGEHEVLDATVRLGLVAAGRARRLPRELVDKLR